MRSAALRCSNSALFTCSSICQSGALVAFANEWPPPKAGSGFTPAKWLRGIVSRQGRSSAAGRPYRSEHPTAAGNHELTYAASASS